MRLIRYAFLTILAVALIAVAFGNRDVVTLRLLPSELDNIVGAAWTINLPLFIVVFLSIIAGLIIGFLWEWIRESSIRGEAARHKADAHELKREVRKLQTEPTQPKDDVLALLEDSK